MRKLVELKFNKVLCLLQIVTFKNNSTYIKLNALNLQVLKFELNSTVLYIYNLFYIEYVKHSAIQLEL